MKKTIISTEIMELIGRSFPCVSADEPDGWLIAGAVHIKGAAFHSIFFRNQRIFRAVYAVKIAHRHKLSNRNIHYGDTTSVTSVTRPRYSR